MSTAEDHLKFMTSFEQEQHDKVATPVEIPAGDLLHADTGVTPDLDRLTRLAERAAPSDIAMAVLQGVGVAPDPELVEMYRAEAQDIWIRAGGNIPESDQSQYEVKTQIIRHHDLLAERVRSADAYQQSLWTDYHNRTGQNVDKVMELYDDTEAFNDTPVIKTFDSLHFRLRGDDRIKDAERIVRFMLRNEARAEQQ